MLEIQAQILPHGEGLPLPRPQTEGSAGLDLYAAINKSETLIIPPLSRVVVPTGLCLEIPKGYEGQVRSRSGLSIKYGLIVLNAPGTIDSDYRGEIKVLLFNTGSDDVVVGRGDRIAQLVIAPYTINRLYLGLVLSPTDRGLNGFGSTGGI